jgi:hypothetical protein
MSNEWLAKLAEMSGDKDLLRRAAEARSRQAPAVSRHEGRRSLIGAALGFFFPLLILAALIEAAAMFFVSEAQGFREEPLGYIFLYTIWYFFDWFPQGVGEFQNLLPFVTPIAAAAAATLYFLPSINAKRVGNPIRFLVYLVNLGFGWSLIGWLIAFALSFVPGRSRPWRMPATLLPTPRRSTPASEPARAASSESTRTRKRPSRAAAVAQTSPVQASPVTRREPTVTRLGDRGTSWVRPR